MKRYINTVFVIICVTVSASGQNTPTGSTQGMYSAPTLAPLPTPYNQGINVTGNANTWMLAAQPTPKLNYIRKWTPQLPVSTISNQNIDGPDNNLITTEYVNGWGSPLQANVRAGGQNNRDVIAIKDHREGQDSYSFLPYAGPKQSKFIFAPFDDQRTYYNNTYSSESGTSYAKSTGPLDQSTPAGTSYNAGKAYVGNNNGITTQTTFNAANEMRRIELGQTGIPYIYGYYDANQLKITTTTGQHGSEAKKYYNKDNQVICKSVKGNVVNGSNEWLNTYYIYNDMGKLVMIIPPKGFNTNYTANLDQCFTYEYNKFGGVTRKYSPGIEVGSFEYFVYDRMHRQVLYQSPQMKEDGTYKFTLYDNQDRVVAEGTLNSAWSAAYWQSEIDTATSITQGTLLDYIVNEHPANLVTIPDCDVLVFNVYDGKRIIPGFTPSDIYYTGHAQYYRTDAGAVTPVLYKLSQGLLTGSAVRVVDTANNANDLGSNYSITQYDYDREGRLIQTRSTIPWKSLGVDKVITSYQYNFSGKPILTITDHKGPNEGMAGNSKPYTLLQTASYYDATNGSRPTIVKQKLDNEDWRTIATYTYDELGRVSRKSLGGVENQTYSYDVRGTLNGINSNYVQNGQLSSNLPTTFGVQLFNEYGFATPRLDGKLSGIIWRGAGAAPMQSYGYEYDVPGRLGHAEFREYTHSTYISQIDQNGNPIYAQGDNWNKQHTDYTATNMKYDANGNMLSMTQVGVPLGYNSPVYIDVMKYFYGTGNRQSATADAIPYNYHLDEFVDGTCEPTPPSEAEPQEEPPTGNKGDGDPTTIDPYFELGDPPSAPSMGCADYQYDKNGNLTYDGNKWMSVTYNFMNLPVDVTVLNSSGNNNNAASTIHNIYDGAGALLRKIITDNTQSTAKIDTYDYWGAFTYRNDSLLSIQHQEGMAEYNADAALFTYDFFVKDHLGNVRTVVTAAETNGLEYVATNELASANLESSIFANINLVRSSNPMPSTTNTQAELLNGGVDSMRIGAALLLKVMPGDELELSTMHYWENDTLAHTHADSASMFSSLLTTLAGGAGGYSGNEGFDPDIFLQRFPAAGNIPVAYGSIKEAQTDPSLPRAYMNYLVFDRHMRLVAEQSGALQITNVQSAWETIELEGPLTIGQDGYVLVYVSDETDINVHFDQVKVKFYKGIVKQQQHYYPYGLCIKAGEDNTEPNKYKYQGKKLQDELGMQLYDFHARQYDPQIGKFWGVDPADQYPSGYTGMGNDPANMIDPTGMKAKASKYYNDPVSPYAPLTDYFRDRDRPIGNFEGTDMDFDTHAFLEYMFVQGKGVAADVFFGAMGESGKVGGNNSSSWQWFPCTKEVLEGIIAETFGLTGGALQNKVGTVWQNTYGDFATMMGQPGYVDNNKQFKSDVDGRGGVIPDGISAAKIIYDNGKIVLAPDASWHEVKAGRGTIYKSSFNNQPWGMVTALALENPVYASKGWASLTFATTYNMKISQSLITDAKKMYNINVTQMKAMYRYNNGGYQITFYNPAIISDFQMRYLSPMRPSVYLNLK